MDKIKILCVIGPTASGKSELAVKIAKKLNGEILSVDSRQIYKGMDIGTGKIKGRRATIQGKTCIIYKGIRHFGIDLEDPKKQYSVAKFQKYAKKIIKEIHSRGKLPILCGGTAHWVDAVVFEQKFPSVPPNKKLRDDLENNSANSLFRKLAKLDPNRASKIDPNNKRRLIRALEIISHTNKPIPELKISSPYNTKFIGIETEKTELDNKIQKRLKARIKLGLINEIKNLHKKGCSWKRLEELGLEYKFGALYLQDKITKKQFEEELFLKLTHYAKRQLTWWKRNNEIFWVKDDAEKIITELNL